MTKTSQPIVDAAQKVVEEWRSNSDLYPEHRLRRLSKVIHELDMVGEFSAFAKAIKRV